MTTVPRQIGHEKKDHLLCQAGPSLDSAQEEVTKVGELERHGWKDWLSLCEVEALTSETTPRTWGSELWRNEALAM